MAEAVAEGLSAAAPVDVVEVRSATPLPALGADLVVVGAPPHAFSLPRESTRQDAAQRTGRAVLSATTGLREWLEVDRVGRLQVAAFDTKVRKPSVPGSAARAAEKRLRRLGCSVVAKAQTFYVDGLEGPLLPGELDRARDWGATVGARAAAMTAGTSG